jgi:hypothetical protein
VREGLMKLKRLCLSGVSLSGSGSESGAAAALTVKRHLRTTTDQQMQN